VQQPAQVIVGRSPSGRCSASPWLLQSASTAMAVGVQTEDRHSAEGSWSGDLEVASASGVLREPVKNGSLGDWFGATVADSQSLPPAARGACRVRTLARLRRSQRAGDTFLRIRV